MLINRFFKWKYTMMSGIRGVVFLCFILLMSGCGGEESVDKPIVGSVGDEKPINNASTTTAYFPTTLGSRWVYRNTDGSEWTRQITGADFLDANQYSHALNYYPPIEEGKFDVFKAPTYVATRDRIVRPIKTGEVGHPKPVIDVRYSIRIQMKKNNGRFIRRFGFVGLRTYRIRGFERSDFTFLKPPLVPGKTWRVFSIALRGRHNIHNVATEFTHALEARSVISARISNDLQTVVTPADTFEDCLEILYYDTPSVETTEIRSDLIPLDYEEAHALLETKIHETAAAEFLELLPNIPLGTMWLAPGVGPVKIETQNSTAELIDYAIK